jgi:TnpA family transposase
MQVAISISEGRLSSATLMRRLRSNSRKNRIYKVFREVGRSVRTVALLRYLADPHLRARITAATNKVESYNVERSLDEQRGHPGLSRAQQRALDMHER